jgi:hypothetical protein
MSAASGVTRIIPPAVSLIYALLMPLLFYIYKSEIRLKPFFLIAFALFAIALLMSFVRAYWIPSVLGAAIFFIVIKKKFSIISLSAITLSLILSMGLLSSISNINLSSAIGQGYGRFQAVSSSNPLEADTMIARVRENQLAQVYLNKSLFFGLGFGIADQYVQPHNAFIGMAINGGLFLLISYLIASTVYIFRSISIFKKIDSEDKYLVLTLLLAFLGFLVGSFAQPNGASYHTIPSIAFIWALTELVPILRKTSDA